METASPTARYRDIELLGSGGMATVTLAQDAVLGRFVALKRVHAAGSPREVARLRREALVGASLHHGNLVAVYDVAEEEGGIVIVMEYVRGSTLRDLLAADSAPSSEEALRILEGIASGLDALHARGIIHRDVKPANVLLGEHGVVKLADLGIASIPDRTQSTAGAVLGTFSYMAPEQLEGGRPTPATDVYALAAVAFEMLAGQKARPEGNPLGLAHAMATQPPPDLRASSPHAPAEAARLLQRAMSADPEQRPHTAGELIRRLQDALLPRATVRQPATRTKLPLAPAAPREVAEAQSSGSRRGSAGSGKQEAPLDGPQSARKPRSASAGPPRNRDRYASAGQQPRRSRFVVALLLIGAAALAAVVFALTSSSSPTKRGVLARTSRSAQRAQTAKHATTSTTQTSGTSGAPAAATSPGATSAEAGSPAATVEAFYGAAARHDYPAAWRLADANMRAEVAGYDSFAAQQSAVRSITFQRADTLPGATESEATVAVSTTSVLSGRTDHCTGTVRTVRPQGSWMLDGISINCA